MELTQLSNRKGQRLDATYHPATRPGLLAILGHGVTGNKDRPLMIGVANELARRGIPCIRLSFAGNGDSDGRFEDATITSETEDLVDTLDAFAQGQRVLYVGHSMGAAVGALAAAREPERIRALVSLAGMVHTEAFFQREFGALAPGKDCMWDEPECPLSQAAWDNARQIGSTLGAAAQVKQPWLLLHGTEDDLVPIGDSRDALKVAPGKAKLVEFPGEGHLFSEAAYPLIAQAIDDWLAEND